MDSLVVANVRQRPLRTLVSMVGVALGVVLVVLTVGLARGMMRDAAERQLNVDAEIRFFPPGSLSSIVSASANPLTLNERYADAILHGVDPTPENPDVEPKPPIPGVIAASPVGEYVQSGTGGLGFELVDGIAYASFIKTAPLVIVEGRSFSQRVEDEPVFEAIVDRFYVENGNDIEGHPLRLGSKMMVFGRPFTLVGIYRPSVLGRVKIPLDTMQQLFGGVKNCSFISVKVEKPELDEEVRNTLNRYYPGNNILLTSEMPALYAQGIRPVEIFLDVVIWLALVISVLVILLSMHTTILERTREIGILKSLGASKKFIVFIIEKEAALISVLGVGLGYIASVIGKYGIELNTRLIIDLQGRWLLIAAAIGILGGVLGALYPAIRAARLDAIEALSYE